jgi:transcriptional regulator with XRE-family HTH domain
VNPSVALIERAAEALEVSVAELFGSEPQTARRKPQPSSQLELRMERIKRLPGKEQEFVLCFLDTVLERAEQG